MAPPGPKSRFNSWEKGIAKDEFGKPYLDKNLEPVGVKEYAENRHAWDYPGRPAR